jgi:hypothetical protein
MRQSDGLREMSDSNGFREFLGRIGCLYGKAGLSPPFHLQERAQTWILEGIGVEHCLEEIRSYLAPHSGRHQCGSGDGSLPYVDCAIRQSWDDKHRPPRAKPQRTDRYHQRIGETHRPVDGNSCDPLPSLNFAPPARPQRPPPPPPKPLNRAIDRFDGTHGTGCAKRLQMLGFSRFCVPFVPSLSRLDSA